MTTLKERAADFVSSAGEKPLLGTAMIRAFGLTKIPLLWFIKPSLVELGPERCVLKVPLRRRTKNHLGVMYIGCMVAGADVAGALTAMRSIQDSGRRVDLLFKDLKVDFFKRVEGDAIFTCDDGALVGAAVAETLKTGERVNQPVTVKVTVPNKLGDVVAAEFVLTLTLKARA